MNVKLVKNFETCSAFDIIIASWTDIENYINNQTSKFKSVYYIVNQNADTSKRIIPDLFLSLINENRLVIIGNMMYKHKGHISSPWMTEFWRYSQYYDCTNQGTHWTCLIAKRRPARDLVAEYFADNLEIFGVPNYFVYHGCTIDKLQPYMFKKPMTEQELINWESYSTLKTIHNHYAYENSRIDLVVETITDYFHVTEKTIKPIRAGIPFVAIGSQFYIKNLHKMGFKTFSPWIDESYDNEPDFKKRVYKCCQAFKNFAISKVKQAEIEHICNHNQKRLQKIESLKSNFFKRQAKKIQYQVDQYAKTYE